MSKEILKKLMEGEKKFNQTLFLKTKSVDNENYTIEGKFSTGDIDRHGEVVDQKGWDLTDFLNNPVILFQHDGNQLPVAKCVSIGIDADGDLAGVIQFAVNEYDFAKTVFNMYANGFMRAFSCGFMNTVYEYDSVNEIVILRKNSLYEVSCVSIPANAMALAKSKGFDIKEIETDAVEEDIIKEEDVKDEIVAEKPGGESEIIDEPSGESIEEVQSANSVLNSIINAERTAKKLTRADHVRAINKAITTLLKAKKL
jgi:uncharacterized protein